MKGFESLTIRFVSVVFCLLGTPIVCAQTSEQEQGAWADPMVKQAMIYTVAFAKRDAARDLRTHTPKMLVYGPPCGPAREAAVAKMLAAKYHVEFRRIALCVISEDWALYADSYNRAITDALRHKYGRDVVKKARQMLDAK